MRALKLYILVVLLSIGTLAVVGCASGSSPGGGFFGGVASALGWQPKQERVERASSEKASAALSPLSFTSIPFILAGGIILFLSSGKRGWIPILLGVSLVLLNYLLELLAGSIWFWGSIGIGIVSLAGSYALIRRYTRQHGPGDGLLSHLASRVSTRIRDAGDTPTLQPKTVGTDPEVAHYAESTPTSSPSLASEGSPAPIRGEA